MLFIELGYFSELILFNLFKFSIFIIRLFLFLFLIELIIKLFNFFLKLNDGELFNREFGDRRRIEISSYEEENSPGKLSEGEKQQYESIQTMVNRERIRKYIQKCAVESSDSCSRSNDYKENLIFLCIFLFSLMKYEKTA